MPQDLFSRFYGPRAKARNTDPRTSLEAADSVMRIRESQQHILDVLRAWGPQTDEEIFYHLDAACLIKISPSGARSRRNELVEMRLVADSSERKLTKSGRKTIVWKAL